MFSNETFAPGEREKKVISGDNFYYRQRPKSKFQEGGVKVSCEPTGFQFRSHATGAHSGEPGSEPLHGQGAPGRSPADR